MQAAMRILSGILSAYMILLFIRILLTWFQGSDLGRPVRILHAITDPYLNYFRRFRFLRTERIDFSPIFALVVLVIILNITNSLALYGTITLGLVLAFIVQAIWSAFSFLMSFFFIIIAIRLIALILGASMALTIWHTLDLIIQPFVHWITVKIFRGRAVSYPTGLAVSGGALVVVFLILRFIIGRLIILLQSFPI